MLSFTETALRRGTRQLLSNVNVTIHKKQKVGITGANGVGKSSLFQMLLGEITPDHGDLSLPANAIIAHVAQSTPDSSLSALEYVVQGDAELVEVERKLADAVAAGDGVGQAELHEHLNSIDGYAARARAARLLHGLGFNNPDMDRGVREFSGGWRMRLNLAQALMCRSDLLLLDEPTNHLDLDAVIWVEEWLRAYPGTLLVISHDRDFLDRVITHIAHIEHESLTLYTGNYSDFENLRAERLAQQAATHSRQQREIAHVRSFVDRFRAKATKARQAQSRIKMLERMELINPAHVDSEFSFAFREAEKMPNPLLSIEDMVAGYGDLTVLDNVQFGIQPGDRFGLLGRNGAGKSTFIRVLADDLKILSGERRGAKDLKVGYFAQHQLEQLDPNATPMLHFKRLDPKADDKSLRSYLGGFGFQGDMALAPVAPFSGGEKARLVLALTVYQRPNLLLLDEPTNHLDLEMRHALTRALQEFEGAMVVVSHDRHLLESVADRLFLVADNGVSEFDGDLEDYRRWLLSSRNTRHLESGPTATQGDDSESSAGATVSQAPAQGVDNSREARAQRRREDAEQRKQRQALRKRCQQLEREVEKLTAVKTENQLLLGDNALYEADRWEELKPLMDRQAEIEEQLSRAESEWLEASEALEQQ